jgi:hypothetical protein
VDLGKDRREGCRLMGEEINPNAARRASPRLLQTSFINRPIDLGPALKRTAIERFWLERMAEADLEEQK